MCAHGRAHRLSRIYSLIGWIGGFYERMSSLQLLVPARDDDLWQISTEPIGSVIKRG